MIPALNHSVCILSRIEILPKGHISFGKDFVRFGGCEVRALLAAGGISLFISLFATPAFIQLFKKLQWGAVHQRRWTADPPHQAWNSDHGWFGYSRRRNRRLLRCQAGKRRDSFGLSFACAVHDDRAGSGWVCG